MTVLQLYYTNDNWLFLFFKATLLFLRVYAFTYNSQCEDFSSDQEISGGFVTLRRTFPSSEDT